MSAMAVHKLLTAQKDKVKLKAITVIFTKYGKYGSIQHVLINEILLNHFPVTKATRKQMITCSLCVCLLQLV